MMGHPAKSAFYVEVFVKIFIRNEYVLKTSTNWTEEKEDRKFLNVILAGKADFYMQGTELWLNSSSHSFYGRILFRNS